MGLSKAVMREVSKYNIRINCISPDIIKTRLTMTRDTERQEEWKSASQARRRAGGMRRPHRLHLLSDASSYITGQNIWITGGTI